MIVKQMNMKEVNTKSHVIVVNSDLYSIPFHLLHLFCIDGPTTKTENLPDGSIRKTVVEYRTNEEGQKVKVTRRIRLYKAKVKVNKAIESRKVCYYTCAY